MKKWIALLLALTMTLVCFGATANEMDIAGPRGPELPSTFETDESAGLDHATGADGATMGTDVYLFVNPDTASYVTICVRDAETGSRLVNAMVKITYNGVTAVYGITDENGECSVYLFRDVPYAYSVERDEYETVSGTFTATGETCRVNVGMMKYHTLTIVVKQNGKPRAGVMVRINGEPTLTNDEGKVYAKLTSGLYHINAYPPGQSGVVYRKVRVDGSDKTIYINLDEATGGSGDAAQTQKEFGYDFLVYNKHYGPMDYRATKYLHQLIDVFKKPGETDEQWRERAQRYLDENPNTLVIEAHPDRQQREKGHDLDLTYEDQKTLLYTQNSLMPTGGEVRLWEMEGFDYLIFSNEFVALRFALDELHSGNMPKALALMQMMARGGEWSEVAVPNAPESKLPERDFSLDSSHIDWSLIRPFAFSFDPQEGCELLDDAVFQNTTFEFRITPIVHKNLVSSLSKAAEQPEHSLAEIELQSEANRVQRIHQLYADGSVTDAEAQALYAYLTEGVQEQLTIEELLENRMASKLYRISCWAIYEGVEMDITSLLPGTHVMWAADFNVLKEEGTRTMAAMDPSCKIQRYDLQTVRAIPEKDSEFYNVITRKFYPRTDVDVRLENGEYRSYETNTSVRRASTYARETNASVDALVWVEK